MTVTGSHLKQGTRRLDLREEREIVGPAHPDHAGWNEKHTKHYLCMFTLYPIRKGVTECVHAFPVRRALLLYVLNLLT